MSSLLKPDLNVPRNEQAWTVMRDNDLFGTRFFSVKRLWNREPLDDFYKEALQKYPTEESIDKGEERRLRRKIDRLIIPYLSICYAFYYIDKTTLSYAAIFGIKEDLNLKGTEYNWLSSIFYFGWLAWGIPSNLLMQRSPSGKYLAINIFMWGVLLMAQAASRSFADLAVLRILSGAFEAIADPAFMLFTTMFYRRSEQPSRIAMWYTANGVGVAGGGLLGYAIGHIRGSLRSWRYEYVYPRESDPRQITLLVGNRFLVVGALCSFWGIILFFLLPDSPPTARSFTRDERILAIARVRDNQTGVDNKKFKWDQFRETFLDPKTWLFFLLGFFANIPNGGISNFSTLIINGLGFDTLQTTLLGIPQGALICIWIGLGAVINDRLPTNSRTYVCVLFMLPTIAGTLSFLFAPQHAVVGRLISYYLTGSYQASFVLGLSLVTSNTAGQTKKQLTSAFIWLGACIGNISGPFFYRTQDAPEYRLGIGSMLVSNCVEVLIFIVLRFYLIYLNRKRDRALRALPERVDTAALRDSTLKQSTVGLAGGLSSNTIPENGDGSGSGRTDTRPNENQTAFSDLTDIQNVK
ncbi:hypothetical protein D9757_011269 [Collybiopsis confluens]|uniref:Major facilitator superfamily (MFS) profile domain-containing protein n=1 Tax=Collybiopsis confluens TaxID=2823264 RepID=A0A8H5GH08_9AGAR|nr:hypothetical protein D9757_011269 [Collybiopsis confluens]